MRPSEDPGQATGRYGRYVGLLGLVLGLVVIGTLLARPNGTTSVQPGSEVPPFAVAAALGTLEGDANIATRPNEGQAGSKPACTVRGQEILNICELYEEGPVVLVLFINGGGCQGILDDLQALAPSFPRVRFAAVEIKGERAALRKLVRDRGLTIPVGYDRDGALAALYRVVSCPQVNFIDRGGAVQSKPLLRRPSLAVLRERVRELVAAQTRSHSRR